MANIEKVRDAYPSRHFSTRTLFNKDNVCIIRYKAITEKSLNLIHFPLEITIMDTMLIQLINRKAAGLLHELEELHIIKVLKKNVQPEQNLSKKYAGKLPSSIADELQNYIDQSRQEWNNRNT